MSITHCLRANSSATSATCGCSWPEDQQRFIWLVLDSVVIDSDTGVLAGVVPNDDFAAIFDVAAEDEGSSLG